MRENLAEEIIIYFLIFMQQIHVEFSENGDDMWYKKGENKKSNFPQFIFLWNDWIPNPKKTIADS